MIWCVDVKLTYNINILDATATQNIKLSNYITTLILKTGIKICYFPKAIWAGYADSATYNIITKIEHLDLIY
jgi:hypothetical protein